MSMDAPTSRLLVPLALKVSLDISVGPLSKNPGDTYELFVVSIDMKL